MRIQADARAWQLVRSEGAVPGAAEKETRRRTASADHRRAPHAAAPSLPGQVLRGRFELRVGSNDKGACGAMQRLLVLAAICVALVQAHGSLNPCPEDVRDRGKHTRSPSAERGRRFRRASTRAQAART